MAYTDKRTFGQPKRYPLVRAISSPRDLLKLQREFRQHSPDDSADVELSDGEIGRLLATQREQSSAIEALTARLALLEGLMEMIQDIPAYILQSRWFFGWLLKYHLGKDRWSRLKRFVEKLPAKLESKTPETET